MDVVHIFLLKVLFKSTEVAAFILKGYFMNGKQHRNLTKGRRRMN